MRKQYHFRPTRDGLLIWDVDRLIELTDRLPIREIPLGNIQELDEAFWFEDRDLPPTCRRVAEHAKLIDKADLSFPIILSQEGRVMDGMHRVCKALLLNLDSIRVVQFDVDPEPDAIDVSPDKLPY